MDDWVQVAVGLVTTKAIEGGPGPYGRTRLSHRMGEVEIVARWSRQDHRLSALDSGWCELREPYRDTPPRTISIGLALTLLGARVTDDGEQLWDPYTRRCLDSLAEPPAVEEDQVSEAAE